MLFIIAMAIVLIYVFKFENHDNCEPMTDEELDWANAGIFYDDCDD